MAFVPVGEQPLVGGLDVVVELLDEPGPQLFDEGPVLETGEQQPERTEDDVGVHEIGPDGLVDARVLNLDRDLEPAVRDRAVDLADRRGRDRIRVPLREDAFGRPAELLADEPRAQLGGHRRRVLLQRGECLAHRRCEPVVEIARHLPELHQRALQLAEHARDVGGGAELVLGVELGATFGWRDGAAHHVDGMARPGAHTDRGEPSVARDDRVAHERDERLPATRLRGAPPAPGPQRDGDGRGGGEQERRDGRRPHMATVPGTHYT